MTGKSIGFKGVGIFFVEWLENFKFSFAISNNCFYFRFVIK